jgi:hypothetical protein
MFSWGKKVIDCLEGSTKLGDTMRDGQPFMVACLLELGHNLMTSPQFNLSCVPGFEAAGLIPFEKDNHQSTLNVIVTSSSEHDHMSSSTAIFEDGLHFDAWVDCKKFDFWC